MCLIEPASPFPTQERAAHSPGPITMMHALERTRQIETPGDLDDK